MAKRISGKNPIRPGKGVKRTALTQEEFRRQVLESKRPGQGGAMGQPTPMPQIESSDIPLVQTFLDFIRFMRGMQLPPQAQPTPTASQRSRPQRGQAQPNTFLATRPTRLIVGETPETVQVNPLLPGARPGLAVEGRISRPPTPPKLPVPFIRPQLGATRGFPGAKTVTKPFIRHQVGGTRGFPGLTPRQFQMQTPFQLPRPTTGRPDFTEGIRSAANVPPLPAQPLEIANWQKMIREGRWDELQQVFGAFPSLGPTIQGLVDRFAEEQAQGGGGDLGFDFGGGGGGFPDPRAQLNELIQEYKRRFPGVLPDELDANNWGSLPLWNWQIQIINSLIGNIGQPFESILLPGLPGPFAASPGAAFRQFGG